MAVFTSRSMDGKVSDSSAAEAAARPTSADEPAVFGCEERRLGGCTEPADPRRASPTLRRLSRGMISPVHAPPPLQPQATDPTPQRAHSKGRRCAGTTGHNALALLNQQQQDSAKMLLERLESTRLEIVRKKERSRTEIEALVLSFNIKLQQSAPSRRLFLPDSDMMQWWALVMTVALIWTAVMTPFEVGVLPLDGLRNKTHPIYVVNQLTNVIFMCDIYVTFHLAFVIVPAPGATHAREGQLETSLGQIRLRYVRSGRLFFDAFIAMPWDELDALLNRMMHGKSATALVHTRLLRLARLVRLVKFEIKPKVYDFLEARHSISTAYYTLLGLLVKVLTVGHFLACLWVFVGSINCGATDSHGNLNNMARIKSCPDPRSRRSDRECAYCASNSWLEGLQKTLGRRSIAGLGDFEKYWAAMYWAMYTLTSVGYGDVASTNTLEMQVCTFTIIFGSLLWAYIIATQCRVINSVSADAVAHEQIMTNVNNFLKSKSMPLKFGTALRRFFSRRHAIQQSHREHEIIAMMSPGLRVVAVRHRSAWLFRVPFLARGLHNVGSGAENLCFITEIEHALQGQIYPPLEQVEWRDSLTTLSVGLVARIGRVMRKGAYWGEDFLLGNPKLKRRDPVHTLAYTELLSIGRDHFFDLLSNFPDQIPEVRRFILRCVFKGGFRYVAHLIRTNNVAALHKLTLRTKSRKPKENPATPTSTTTPTGRRPSKAHEGNIAAASPSSPSSSDSEDGEEEDDDDEIDFPNYGRRASNLSMPSSSGRDQTGAIDLRPRKSPMAYRRHTSALSIDTALLRIATLERQVGQLAAQRAGEFEVRLSNLQKPRRRTSTGIGGFSKHM